MSESNVSSVSGEVVGRGAWNARLDGQAQKVTLAGQFDVWLTARECNEWTEYIRDHSAFKEWVRAQLRVTCAIEQGKAFPEVEVLNDQMMETKKELYEVARKWAEELPGMVGVLGGFRARLVREKKSESEKSCESVDSRGTVGREEGEGETAVEP